MTCGARLPLGSSPIPMSGPGQNRKSSRRAYVFRLTSESGHCATESACPFRARFGTQVERRTKSNEAPNPHMTAPEARTQVGHQAMSEKCQRRKWWCDVVMSVLPLTSDLSCHAARGKLSVAF
jgi:hypothetical protein